MMPKVTDVVANQSTDDSTFAPIGRIETTASAESLMVEGSAMVSRRSHSMRCSGCKARANS